MRIFEFVSLLMLISVYSKVNCLTFKCSFKIEAENDNSRQSKSKIICGAKIESYDEDGFKVVATNKTAMGNLGSDYERNNNDSLLLKHIGVKSIEEITEVVTVVGHKCVLHPQGVGLAFSSIKSFTLADGPLWRLRKQDLKQFPELSNAHYNGNEIEYLETDLFIFNPKLTRIGLMSNRITQISSKLGIEKSELIDMFDLSYNRCMSKTFYFKSSDRPEKLKEFQAYTQENCAENVPGVIPGMISEFQSTTKRLDSEITKLGTDLQDLRKDLVAIVDKQGLEIKQDITNIQNTHKRIYHIIELALEESDSK